MAGGLSKTDPAPANGGRTHPAGFGARFAAEFTRIFGSLIDRPIPPELLANPESARHAKLITRFGALGSLFGFTYAVFYLAIGHKWGATIILFCSSGVAVTPLVLRWRKSVRAAGHFFSLTLTLGFTGLCFVEGGVHGHAIAWLVSVPLCALLLLGRRPAARWAVVSFVAASVVVGFDLAGRRLPITYDPQWRSVVSAAGYLGLILFMFILGQIFEVGRARAIAKMQGALKELADSNERLVHLNNEKNEFLGIAAHDLKNPLTVILGNAELMTMVEDPGKINKLANTIAAAAKRMRNLINDLLDANAIEQGKFTSKIERCDVGLLVRECVENNQLSAAKKDITIRVGMSQGLMARADRTATLQILDNLISNALKFSPPNTTIHVHSAPEKDFALVSVRDEGPGISAEDQKKLFKKFVRLSARPTGGESSTGLGLSIVKKLAEAMAGTIQCHSALGTGTTFVLRLPVWTGDPPDVSAPAAVKPRTRTGVPELLPHVTARN